MPTLRHLLRPALLALGVQLGTFPVGADDQAAVAMARTRFQEGVEFFDAGRFEEARVAFLQAHAIKPHPSVLLNLAQCELKVGRYVEAADRFSEYIAGASDGAEAEKDLAEHGLAEARRHIGELRVTADVERAELFVDGRSVGTIPLARPIFVLPGPHRLQAQAGSHSAEQEVAAESASVHSVELVLLPIRTQVTLRPIPTSPEPRDRGGPTTDEQQPSFGHWLVSSPMGLTGLVATGAGVALGTTGAIVASNRYGAARDATDTLTEAAEGENRTGTICSNGTSPLPRYRTACEERQGMLNQGDTWRGLAIGGFVLAGAAALGTVAYYFIDMPPAAPREPELGGLPRVVPIVTPHTRGISIVGTF